MQDHEDRLDVAGTRRSINDAPPLVYSPYATMDAPSPFDQTAKKRTPDRKARLKHIRSSIEEKPKSRNFSIMDAQAAHVAGAKISKAASKALLHGFMQFPTNIDISEHNQRAMLSIAIDFINETYGGNAVFHARIDRDEVGQHGVDVFFAPRYEKHTKSKGTEQWISLSKFSKENARTRYGKRQKTVKNKRTGEFDPVFDDDGKPVQIWNDADVFQGRALQDAWFEHLKESVGNKFEVERGKRKKGSDPDRLSPEDYALQKEQKKFQNELKRQLEPATPEEATANPYEEPIAKMVAEAQEKVAEIVLRAHESAEADVRAITYSMLNDEGREFIEAKEENRLLHQTVKRQSAMLEILLDTLKRLVPDGLRKRVRDAVERVWANHPENSDGSRVQSSNNWPRDAKTR
ncbi:MAG: hypothetical protein ABJO88_13755 [Parasphingorhabdus sp.]